MSRTTEGVLRMVLLLALAPASLVADGQVQFFNIAEPQLLKDNMIDADEPFSLRVASDIVSGYLGVTAEINQYDLEMANHQIRDDRLGLLIRNRGHNGIRFNSKLEAIRQKVDRHNANDKHIGGGIHLGVERQWSRSFLTHASGGYMRVGDAQGPEFSIGAEVKLSHRLGLFADYRHSQYSENGNSKKLDVLLVSGGYHF